MVIGESGMERLDYRQGCPPLSLLSSHWPSLSSQTLMYPCVQVTMIHVLE